MGSSISALLGNYAKPIEIEYNGATYRARPLIQVVKSEWERWLYQRQVDAIKPFAGMVPEATFFKWCQDIAAANVRGDYRWGTTLSEGALQTPGGALAFSALIFGVSEAMMVELTAARPVETRLALQTILAESFPDPTPGEGAGKGPEGNG